MSKLIDLTGQVIGNWKVIERAKSLGSPHGKKSTSWKCQCVKNPEYIVVKRSQELRKITKETCRSCKGCHESDLSGKQFGRWRVINKADDYVDSKGRAYHMWNCECSCKKHTRRAVLAKNLIRGTTKSCGCIPADYCREHFSTHKKTGTRLYRIWSGMRRRCNNPNNPAYVNYGARNIGICTEWQDFEMFEKWAISHGYSDNLTIDRIDNNSGYYPSNCRWVDYATQANNTRNNVHITNNGETHTASEWGKITNLPSYEILFRIHHGWTEDDALKTPLNHKRKSMQP